MGYHQFEPAPELQPFVDAYWTIRYDQSTVPVQQRILPDGCVDLICNWGDPVTSKNEYAAAELRSDSIYLVGTMTRFVDTIHPSSSHLTGIRFKPAAFPLFFDEPLQHSTDQCIPLGRKLLDLFTSRNDLFSHIDQFLLRRKKSVQSDIFPLIEQITRSKGIVKVEQLAKMHYITRRQLERKFQQYLGIAPKEFIDLIRFRHAFGSVMQRKQQESFEDIAIESGYYDHAHLTNALKKYSGLTPSVLSHSSKDPLLTVA